MSQSWHSAGAHFMEHTLTPEQREEWMERTAILIYEAGIDPEWAPTDAGKICMQRWEKEKRSK